MSLEILQLKDITKIYDNGIVANRNINLKVNEGEIHAIVGENGAGKSTLMNIIFGLVQPTSGTYYYKGEEVSINNVDEALELGIGMVHQHFMLVDSFDIIDNIMLGIEPKKGLFINKEESKQRVMEIAKKYSFDLDYDKPISEISVGMRQKVEILKALIRGAEVLILDEPTAVLTPQETEELFVQLKLLRDDGHTIIFISHKLNEVKEISDRISVIRKGESQGTYSTKEVSLSEITELMIGRALVTDYSKNDANYGSEVLSLNNVSYKLDDKDILKDISFTIPEGMIFSIAGVEGNGQSEIVDIITRTINNYTGEIKFSNKDIKKLNLRYMRELGLSYIPEDRMGKGIAGENTVAENLLSTSFKESRFNRNFLMNNREISNYSKEIIKSYQVVCNGPEHIVNHLSGGNIQKVVVGRECAQSPKLLVAEQPTRGVDLGAAELIHNKLLDMRDEGISTLLVSADLREILELSDECIVVYDGKITAHIKNMTSVTEQDLGAYMLGLKTQEKGQVL